MPRANPARKRTNFIALLCIPPHPNPTQKKENSSRGKPKTNDSLGINLCGIIGCFPRAVPDIVTKRHNLTQREKENRTRFAKSVLPAIMAM
jgi:hypothetical protein